MLAAYDAFTESMFARSLAVYIVFINHHGEFDRIAPEEDLSKKSKS